MRMHRIVMAGMTAALLLQAPAVLAQDAHPRGPFIGIMGGASFLDDADIDGPGVNTSAETDTGWLALGTLGYRFGNGFRTELEAGWRENDVDQVFGAASGAGDISAKSLMANLVYDIRTGGRLMPFIGGGLGYAQIDYDGVAPLNLARNRVNDEDHVFAYQGLAGVSYWMSDVVELTTEYRYMATQDPEFKTATGVGVDGEYQSHAVLLGLRWNFGAPREPTPVPAAATPAPEPAPVAEPEPAAMPRNFQVFFDWDKSDITPEAAGILRDAADYAKANSATRIVATGHADRSGPEPYNMALSMRRAEAVKRQLIANGISESEIGVDARGETDPLVPTEDGVREPQNRRVEIVLQ